MAEISVSIGGRTHRVACRDGEEAELAAAAALLEEQAQLVAGLGPATDARVLLLAGLLLADRLREERAGAPQPSSPAAAIDGGVLARVADLTARAEALADRLSGTT